MTLHAVHAQKDSHQDSANPHRISIYFGGGSYYIDPEQKQKVVDYLKKIDNITLYEISVHSYTDNIGGAAYNKWLSSMRSEAAVSLLVGLDVPEYQITIKDFGQFNPLYSNDTWLGRMKNRRVDILFWPIVL